MNQLFTDLKEHDGISQSFEIKEGEQLVVTGKYGGPPLIIKSPNDNVNRTGIVDLPQAVCIGHVVE